MGKYSLHDLPKEERPRERLQEKGVDSLSLQELLAIIIEKGGSGRNVMQVAQNLLSCFGNIRGVKKASIEELKRVKGIGVATACKLKAAFKLGEKAEQPELRAEKKVNSAGAVFSLMRPLIGGKKREHFMLLSLNARGCLIKADKISIGSLTTSISHPREVFKKAIKNSADSVIIVHNHPSGNKQPSKSDVVITKRMKKAGKLLGIQLSDHLIITENDYFSFAANNLM